MTKPLEKKQVEVWDVFGEKIICKVSGDETFGRFALVEEISAPQSAVPPHFHNETDEIIYILDGKYELEIDGKTQIAQKGDTVVVPRKTTHSFRNLLEIESKLLAVITPSGFENFFAEVNKLKQFDISQIIEIGKRNDLELVM